MINHIRTLLINRRGTSLPAFGTLDVFTQPDFQPSADPPEIAALREALFGRSPDGLFVNYRAHMYMRMLHASPWAAYLTHGDSRLTYDISKTNMFSLFQTAVSPIPDNVPVSVNGYHWADERLGLCRKTWLVALSEGILKVTDEVANTVTTSAYTNVLALPDSQLRLALPATALTAFTVRVVSLAKPRKTLADILNLLDDGLAMQAATTIFADTSNSDIKALQSLWLNEPIKLCRYSAFFLGLAKYTELMQA